MFKKAVFLFFFLPVCVCMQAKDYFVKMNGDGSGSSWEDALSPKGFAEKVEDGEPGTYHFAEGTYYPAIEFLRHKSGFYDYYTRAYQIKTDMKIVGGYPPEPQEDAVSEPDKYKTIFSADYDKNDIVSFSKSTFGNGNDSVIVANDADNDQIIFELVSPNINFDVYGVQLMHAGFSAIFTEEECKIEVHKCVFMDNGGAGVMHYVPVTFVMDSCRSYRTAFKAGVATVYAPFSYEVSVTNSIFQSNGTYMANAGGAVYIAGGKVENCLFYKCHSDQGAAIATTDDASTYISNCTFVGNNSYAQAAVASFGMAPDTIVNCTMVGNTTVLCPERYNIVRYEKNCHVEGNYIVGKPFFSMLDDPDESLTFKNNVLTDNVIGFFGDFEIDGSNTTLDEKTALTGLGMSSSFDFTVVDTSLNYVPLLVDVLADKSIRFPRVVGTDARGVERCELTCPGAYEIRNCDEPQCLPDTTIASPSDTIYAGQMFLGKTYAEVGRHDSIYEHLKDINGCDSVVMHTLIVLPDPSGVDSYPSDEVRIIPNPVTGLLRVTIDERFSYVITDLFGRVVGEGESCGGTIAVSTLPDGFYFLRINYMGKQKTLPFVKVE